MPDALELLFGVRGTRRDGGAVLLDADTFNRADGAPGVPWVAVLGTWLIAANQLAETVQGGDEYRIAAETAYANGQITAHVTIPATGRFARVLFRAASNGTDHWLVELDATFNRVRLRAMSGSGGSYSSVEAAGSYTKTIARDTPHEVVITCAGSALSVSVDGEVCFNAFASSGRYSLQTGIGFAGSGVSALYDDIAITG